MNEHMSKFPFLSLVQWAQLEWLFEKSDYNLRETYANLLTGLSPTRIAALRDLSPGTVRNQASAIYQALGVASQAELIAVTYRDYLAA